MDLLSKKKNHIMFFTWFENYCSQKGICYLFYDINVLKNWKNANGEIYSEHPPLREFKISHDESSIVASPFKIKPDMKLKRKILEISYTKIILPTNILVL